MKFKKKVLKEIRKESGKNAAKLFESMVSEIVHGVAENQSLPLEGGEDAFYELYSYGYVEICCDGERFWYELTAPGQSLTEQEIDILGVRH